MQVITAKCFKAIVNLSCGVLDFEIAEADFGKDLAVFVCFEEAFYGLVVFEEAFLDFGQDAS